jgi:hypothetical protein
MEAKVAAQMAIIKTIAGFHAVATGLGFDCIVLMVVKMAHFVLAADFVVQLSQA